MSIHLFKHNQEAYNSVTAMLEREKMAAVIHPTGTWKDCIRDDTRRSYRPGILPEPKYVIAMYSYKKELDQALTKEQQEQLAALGMIWDRNTEKWEEYFEAAQEYYRQHGNLDVMAKYVTEEGLPLGRWLSDISNKVSDENLRRVSLTDEQLERLKSIGFKQEKRQPDSGMRNMSWQRIITKYMEI